MKISELKLNPNNPQKWTDGEIEKLKNSIKQFPKMLSLRPLVYNPETGFVLGGNKRLVCLRELGFDELPDNWTKSASELTAEEMERFVVQDNVQTGEWDFEILAENWDIEELEDWGVNLEGLQLDEAEFGDAFSITDGEKSPFEQMTFTFSDKQAEIIKSVLSKIKKLDKFADVETFGNENSNGNALFFIINNWENGKN